MWPTDLIPHSCSFYLQHNTTIFISPITRSRQALRRGGDRWLCTASFRLGREKAQRMDSLLASLRGAYETIPIWDFARPHPLGRNLDRSTLPLTEFDDIGPPSATKFADTTSFSGGGDVVVDGNFSMGATSILTDGWRQNIADELKAGDYIQIGDYLHMLTADADSNAFGRATLNIAPRLPANITDGDAVIRTYASAKMQLQDDDQPSRNIAVNGAYEYTLSFVQAL